MEFGLKGSGLRSVAERRGTGVRAERPKKKKGGEINNTTRRRKRILPLRRG